MKTDVLLPQWPAALALTMTLLVIYNANGREIGSYDSQPTKFLAREIALRHTFSLDRVVQQTPAFAERAGFARGLDGHYRSAYSVVPALLAVPPAWLLAAAGANLDATLAPSLIAKLTASLLTTATVLFALGIARRQGAGRGAVWIAAGLGFGTNLWATASQTLWQHETAVFGIAASLYVLSARSERIGSAQMMAAFAGLALAVSARPQVAPALMIVALAVIIRGGVRRVWTAWPLVASVALVMTINLQWFGDVRGAVPMRESLHAQVHAVKSPISSTPWTGAAGLLFSPSRGILVFSPVTLVGLLGFRQLRMKWRRDVLPWCATAALTQFCAYAAYSVWWGGHTFGPRYLIDVLPFLVPGAAVAIQTLVGSPVRLVAAGILLAWSVIVAATGAFCYPADEWNSDPLDVDRHHERLWDWRDSQILRCWTRGPSPQNWDFFRYGSEIWRRAETR